MTLALPHLPTLAHLDTVEHRFGRPAWRYPLLVALACSLSWLVLTQIVRVIGFGGFYGVPFALAAVIVAAWMAGLGSGILTAALSVAMLYVILPSMRIMDVREESLWHLVVFSFVAFLMSSFEASLRRQHQQELRDKEMRDEFLAIVSHELRTPVTIINGSASLLSRIYDTMSPSERDELLTSLREESSRLSRMIDDLLLLGRLKNGQEVAEEPILLNPIIEHAVESFAYLYPSREIDVHLPADRIVICGRETYVDAVLRNVLSNAHRFSPGDATIELHGEGRPDGAVISIRDHGPGIKPALMKEIFEPYYRSQPISDGTRGIGLGLTLCRRAMEAMGGSITANNAPGGGLNVDLHFHSLASSRLVIDTEELEV